MEVDRRLILIFFCSMTETLVTRDWFSPRVALTGGGRKRSFNDLYNILYCFSICSPKLNCNVACGKDGHASIYHFTLRFVYVCLG